MRALPAPGVIHVWRLATENADASAFADLLTADERDRAARFMFERDRAEFTAVRGALRRLLGQYSGRSGAQLQFVYGTEGKPALAPGAAGTRIEFNVSHSHGQALLAFAIDRDVGVDVEWHNGRTNIGELAPACFSDDEHVLLNTSAVEERRTAFYRLWSCKEAYIKARGGGLAIPLRDFSVDIVPAGGRCGVRTVAPVERFTVQPVVVPAQYSGAVAAPGEDWRHDIFDF